MSIQRHICEETLATSRAGVNSVRLVMVNHVFPQQNFIPENLVADGASGHLNFVTIVLVLIEGRFIGEPFGALLALENLILPGMLDFHVNFVVSRKFNFFYSTNFTIHLKNKSYLRVL